MKSSEMAKELYVGDKVNTSMGETIILEMSKDYMVLYHDVDVRFIVAHWYEHHNGRLVWQQGEYYNSLRDLMENL